MLQFEAKPCGLENLGKPTTTEREESEEEEGGSFVKQQQQPVCVCLSAMGVCTLYDYTVGRCVVWWLCVREWYQPGLVVVLVGRREREGRRSTKAMAWNTHSAAA